MKGIFPASVDSSNEGWGDRHGLTFPELICVTLSRWFWPQSRLQAAPLQTKPRSEDQILDRRCGSMWLRSEYRFHTSDLNGCTRNTSDCESSVYLPTSSRTQRSDLPAFNTALMRVC